MSRTWTIARRELASFFDSLIAYILLVVFLGVSGIFTWMLGSDVFLRGRRTCRPSSASPAGRSTSSCRRSPCARWPRNGAPAPWTCC